MTQLNQVAGGGHVQEQQLADPGYLARYREDDHPGLRILWQVGESDGGRS